MYFFCKIAKMMKLENSEFEAEGRQTFIYFPRQLSSANVEANPEPAIAIDRSGTAPGKLPDRSSSCNSCAIT